VDAGYQAGNTVTPFYDPLLAKLCVHGADRAQALERARDAVATFRIAAGEPPSFDPASVTPEGHAIELRVYAEDPVRFLPGPGAITEWEEPAGDGVRVDAGYQAGNTVTPFYDPLLAKLCVHGADRGQALDRARAAVAAFRITGPKVNLPFHADLLTSTEFVAGDYDTSLVSKLRPR
jgi:acetyl-CoA carboxylase biotin carboxylase subunit